VPNDTALPVRKMSIFQSQFWGAARHSWPGDCFPVVHQPFPSMVSISPPQPAVSPEVSLVSSQTKISGMGEKLSSISARPLIGILCGSAVFCLIGIAFAFWLRTVPAGNPDPQLGFNVFYVLFARHEPAGLAVVAAMQRASNVIKIRIGRDSCAFCSRQLLSSLPHSGHKLCFITMP